MKVAIMTDTNSSITIEEGKRDGIFLMTLPVIIGDKTYIEGENLSTKELYQGMADGVPVKTSQPSPQDLMDMWQSILDEGYDEIVYIPMTLTLSSSYSTAAAFAQEFDGKVQVVNNYRLSSMLYEAVYDAKAYAEKGMSAKEIKEKLESESKNSFMVLTVDTLKYLKEGGRVSASKFLVANLANIKPIMILHEAKIDAVKKARGLNMAKNKLVAYVKEKVEELYNEYAPERISIGIIDTFLNDEDSKDLLERVKKVFPDLKIMARKCPCSIACHVGANALAVSATVMGER